MKFEVNAAMTVGNHHKVFALSVLALESVLDLGQDAGGGASGARREKGSFLVT